MFPETFVALRSDSGFVSRSVGVSTICANGARNAIKQHGTPLRLLEMFFRKLGARVILFQGSVCRHIHVPTDWGERRPQDKTSVILNVWNNHVFTYTREVADIPVAISNPEHHGFKPVNLKVDDDDRSAYEDMVPFGWAGLTIAIPDKADGTVFWTTEIIDNCCLKGMDQLNVSYLPRWPTYTQCRSVFITLGNKKNGILIKHAPLNHKLLDQFC